MKTSYQYEASGCGCGGFSALVEDVKHESPLGETLFQTERRYDVVGNVTAERRNHQGGFGEVHGFDDTYRLTDEYWGVDLSGANLDAQLPGVGPADFAFQRSYNLDSRGNRYGNGTSTPFGVEDRDSSGNLIKGTSYAPNSDTNVYDSIDGQAYNFDIAEQLTIDPTTGLHHAYDYKGQEILTDDDSDFSSPERRYYYDTHGRMRVEERWVNTYAEPVDFTQYNYPCECPSCGCNNQGNIITEALTMPAATPSSPSASVQNTDGVAATGSGSSGVNSPYMVYPLPGVGRYGNWPIVELIDCGGNLTWHYRCEDQLGTLRGMTDAAGNRVAEIDTSKYGEVYPKGILFDGRASRIAGAVSDVESDITHIDLLPDFPAPETAYGAILRASNSSAVATAPVFVVESAGAFIEIYDPTDAVLEILNGGGQFVIFDQHIGSYSGGANTGGTWTGASFSGGVTTLTQVGEVFAPYITGWQVQLDAARPVYFDILSAVGDSITVAGDLTSLVTAGETEFCIIHPVGVNPQNGATQTDPCQPESRYLWGGGYYLPPIAGFEMWHDGVFGIHGQQPGQNKSGQHYMWNRIYDINMGRWTTPDPLKSRWTNPGRYARSPLHGSDPTGLSESDSGACAGVISQAWLDYLDNTEVTPGSWCNAIKKLQGVVANMWDESRADAITQCQHWLNNQWFHCTQANMKPRRSHAHDATKNITDREAAQQRMAARIAAGVPARIGSCPADDVYVNPGEPGTYGRTTSVPHPWGGWAGGGIMPDPGSYPGEVFGSLIDPELLWQPPGGWPDPWTAAHFADLSPEAQDRIKKLYADEWIRAGRGPSIGSRLGDWLREQIENASNGIRDSASRTGSKLEKDIEGALDDLFNPKKWAEKTSGGHWDGFGSRGADGKYWD